VAKIQLLRTDVYKLPQFPFFKFFVAGKWKEIGVKKTMGATRSALRKVLGANETNIMVMLSSGFTKLVMLSLTIALPLSYLFAVKWLNGFAYRIQLSWWRFAAAGSAALLMTWCTIGMQTWKAAYERPVKYLKTE
jgi:putative ABC transport system permease protein